MSDQLQKLAGMNVIINPHIPVDQSNFKLSDKVPLTDEARKRHQKWLDDFFGRSPVVYVFQNPLGGPPSIFANPESVVMLKNLGK